MPPGFHRSCVLHVMWICVLSGLASVGLAALNTPAPQSYYHRAWQIEEGLPSAVTSRIVQDHKGYLWVATMAGLVRFDGLNFQNYHSPLVAGQTARNIRALVREDNQTVLLLPAVGGVIRCRNGEFSRHPMSDRLLGKQLDALFAEPGGAIWVGMEDEGIARWQDDRIEMFGQAEGFNRGGSRVFFTSDREGQVWVAAGGFCGIYREGTLVPQTNSAGTSLVVARSRSGGVWLAGNEKLQRLAGGEPVTIPDTPWKITPAIREMYEDRSGALWVGTISEGLYRYAEGKFTRMETSHQRINSITEDHEGNIWATTEGGGINRLRPRLFRTFNARTGLVEDQSETVCEDSAGILWLANRSGGLARISNGQLDFPRPPGTARFNVNAACADDRGNLWLGAIGLARFDPQTSSLTNLLGASARVRALFKDSQGRMWIGGDDNLLKCFDGEDVRTYARTDGYSGQRARYIAEDHDGSIWIGTEEGALFRLREDQFKQFTEKDGLPGLPLRTIHFSQDGLALIATIRGGLLLFKDGRFHRISRSEGLPDDSISQLLEDEQGLIWCGSSAGIFSVPKNEILALAEGTIRQVNSVTFGKSEGLSGGYCLDNFQPMAWKSRDGRMWFPTRQGVVSLDPAAVRQNPHPPPLDIREVLVQDQPVSTGHPIEVPSGSRKIEFRFAALSFAAPEKVRLRHLLEGVDPDWNETGKDRNAIYSGLAPGHYRLRLTACNNDGVWNRSGATLAFVVLPAWWQTVWFRMGGLTAFAGLVAVIARYYSHRRLSLRLDRLERQEALERERKRIARDLHDDVGASIAQVGLALEELKEQPSTEETRIQSGHLANQMRLLARDLDAVVWTVDPRNDSLAELVAYLGQCFLEHFRGTSIRPRLEVAENIPDHPLSPEVRHHLFLTAREAMSNVLKHSHATEAKLSLSVVKDTFELKLQDDGCGFLPEKAAESKRNGLRNIRSRIEEIGGELHMDSAPGRGTTILVRVPLFRTARQDPQSKGP